MDDVPILETERLRLRAWRYEDIGPLSEIYAQPEVRRFLPFVDRDGTEWQVAFIVAHWTLEGFALWAVEDRTTGRFLGRIGLTRQVDFREDPAQVEVGWTLSPAVWGRGLAAEGCPGRAGPRLRRARPPAHHLADGAGQRAVPAGHGAVGSRTGARRSSATFTTFGTRSTGPPGSLSGRSRSLPPTQGLTRVSS